MSTKIILSTVSVVFLIVAVGNAQQVSPTRAFDLYADYDRTQSCPNCNHQLPRPALYGWKGHPWRDKRPGGCQCGKRSALTWYNGYHHWPSPWSVLVDHGCDGSKWRSGTDTTCPRFRDKLDIFANIRLAPPVRNDNGYTGRQCDPYGLVGKSRQGATHHTPTPVRQEDIVHFHPESASPDAVVIHPLPQSQNNSWSYPAQQSRPAPSFANTSEAQVPHTRTANAVSSHRQNQSRKNSRFHAWPQPAGQHMPSASGSNKASPAPQAQVPPPQASRVRYPLNALPSVRR